MIRNTKRGFTLIELLVVIAIIGILSSVVLASLNSARQKSRDARRLSDVKQVQLALELSYDANGEYPDALSSLAPTYIAVIPTDPQGGGSYSYANLGASDAACASASGTCTTYVLGATLEDTGHSALDSDIDSTVGPTGDQVDCSDTSGIYCVRP
ncbi:MAG TPA: type II secretion system protein [Candidatus Paceibacterota bacterium]